MPKIVKTFRSASSTKSPLEAFSNMVKAVEAALGVTAKKVNNTRYYMPTESIGFPGYCVYLDLSSYSGIYTYAKIGIYTTTASGELNELDPNNIAVGMSNFENNDSWILREYNPATCVLFTDAQKDTISFSVMLSAYEDGSDVSEQTVCGTSLKAFLAKDVNGGILCGAGDNHIYSIRTKDSKATPDPASISIHSTYDLDVLPSCLHLTKMVNYLSPGYPEMKTAYISVVRPQNGYVNESYYAEGALWGFAGYYPTNSITDEGRFFVPAISPWVKY